MSGTRDDILGRLRRQLGRTDATRAEAQARVEAVLAARQCGPRAPSDALVERFIERAQAMLSTVERCPAEAGVPDFCARWLAAQSLPIDLVVAPPFAHLDWAGAGLRMRVGAAGGDDRVGVTGCFRAIAETGTLMLRSGSDMPPVSSLLPETHIAIVPVARIVADMEAAWADARSEWGNAGGAEGGQGWPRAVNFVSGPSRTADIEQVIVLGAHGPFRVHLLVVG